MIEKKTILYVGNFSFPAGNAAGKRVYANGKMLRKLGYDVIFVGMDKRIREPGLLKNTRNEYDGFIYYNFQYPRIKFDWLKYDNILKQLTDLLIDEDILDSLQLVICYGSPRISLFNLKLLNYCKTRNVKIATDCVDWLTVRTNNLLFDFVKFFDNYYQKAYFNKRVDGVIAISNYLSKYYKKQGCLTIVVPPLSTTESMATNRINIQNNKKVITYAGIPFRMGQRVKDCSILKDRIDKTIILLQQAKERGSQFIFNIYGFTKDAYLKSIPEQKYYVDMLGDAIVFHGFRPNEEIIDKIAHSDFTILIRDINRDTTAGFPTKVSESISCGTPVITTTTSDLQNYILEEKNGFFLEMDDDKKALSKLIKILQSDDITIKEMKTFCINSNPFFYEKYAGVMEEFLKEIMKGKYI